MLLALVDSRPLHLVVAWDTRAGTCIVAGQVLDRAEAAVKSGAEVEILRFAA